MSTFLPKCPKWRALSDLAGSRDVDGGAVRGGGHVVALLHQLHLEVLRLQAVDEAGDVRVCG